MEQAIRAYHQITADSEFRELERLREKARYDEASALLHARDEGKAEGMEKPHSKLPGR
jgi:phage shock protein A